jgi:hypothetical protein
MFSERVGIKNKTEKLIYPVLAQHTHPTKGTSILNVLFCIYLPLPIK